MNSNSGGPEIPTTPPSKPIRVLLVDVHSISRNSSRDLFNALPDLEVVGETGNHAEALALATALQPDVVLIGMRVQGASGPETTRSLLQAIPQLRVVFFTFFDDPEYVNAALDAGAQAYVLKQEPALEVLQAITSVMQGRQYLSAALNLQP